MSGARRCVACDGDSFECECFARKLDEARQRELARRPTQAEVRRLLDQIRMRNGDSARRAYPKGTAQ